MNDPSRYKSRSTLGRKPTAKKYPAMEVINEQRAMKYNTRSSLGRNLYNCTSLKGERMKLEPYCTRNPRRTLFPKDAAINSFKPAESNFNIFSSNISGKPQSMLGRRKSLGFNLVSSNSAILNSDHVPSTSLSTETKIKEFKNSRKSLFHDLNKKYDKENFDVRIDLDCKKLLHGGYQDITNVESTKPNGASPDSSKLILPTSQTSHKDLTKQTDQSLPKSQVGCSDDCDRSMNEFLYAEERITANYSSEANKKFIPEPINEETIILDSEQHNNQLSLPVVDSLRVPPLLDSSQHTEQPSNKRQDLTKLLLKKLDEYNELIIATNNKWQEIQQINKLLKENTVSTLSDDQPCQTPSILKKSCSLSIKKMHNDSVKFKNDISTCFIVPHTPVTALKKSTKKKKQSMGYTPKSLKKVLDKQIDQIFNS